MHRVFLWVFFFCYMYRSMNAEIFDNLLMKPDDMVFTGRNKSDKNSFIYIFGIFIRIVKIGIRRNSTITVKMSTQEISKIFQPIFSARGGS